MPPGQTQLGAILGPPPLWYLCIAFVAENIRLVESLEGLPEEIVCELFDRVLACGRLTPSVLRTFKATGHETLLSFIRRAGIADDIPVQDYSFENSWLGYDRRV